MSKNTGPTVDQLRADIDSGLGADKVPATDPAAAPLGTDDEAAGAPPRSEELATAHEHVLNARRGLDQPHVTPDSPRAVATVWGVLAAVIFAAIAAAIWVL